MRKMVLIYGLFPNAGEAHDCCRTLLEERLIASASRFAPAISYFHADGDIATSEEHPVFFKTSPALADRALNRIAQLHRYHAPSIIAIGADSGNQPFHDWVEAQLDV
jgi:periplasmic divalent cation tolerance protein